MEMPHKILDDIEQIKLEQYAWTHKWDGRFLQMCDTVATWSKDPSTKVGAVIVDDNNTIISMGYNGFPRGVVDSHSRYFDRDTKLKLVVHAEANAILNAKSSLRGCTIYINHFSCNECAKLIIQSGIKRVVSYEFEHESKWSESWSVAEMMYGEAQVGVQLYAPRA